MRTKRNYDPSRVCKRTTCQGCPLPKPYGLEFTKQGEVSKYCFEEYGDKYRERGVPSLIVSQETFGVDCTPTKATEDMTEEQINSAKKFKHLPYKITKNVIADWAAQERDDKQRDL